MLPISVIDYEMNRFSLDFTGRVTMTKIHTHIQYIIVVLPFYHYFYHDLLRFTIFYAKLIYNKCSNSHTIYFVL